MSRIGRSLAGGDGAAGPPDATDRAGREHDQLGRAGPSSGPGARRHGATVPVQPPAGHRGRARRPPDRAHARAARRRHHQARRLLAEHDPPLSLTAFVVASRRPGGGRPSRRCTPTATGAGGWSQHRHVDVQTLIEVPTAQGPFGLVHVVRDADVRSVADISAELRAVKADPDTTGTGRMLTPVAPSRRTRSRACTGRCTRR